MNFKKLTVLAACAATLTLTGCSSVSMRSAGYDLSRIDSFVTVNETTISDVRKLFGTPSVIAQTKEGETILGYALVGHNQLAVAARNLGKSAATFGLGSDKREFTEKIALFKFNKDNKLVEVKKDGVSFLRMSRFSVWNECERIMSPEELNSPIVYSDVEICDLYAEEQAAKRGVKVEDIDIGEETPGCNLPCQVRRSVVRNFDNVVSMDDIIDAAEGDGSRFREVFP